MKIVTSLAMARIDARAQAEFAMPSAVLMEDAGVKGWDALCSVAGGERLCRSGHVVFVAGSGNNGGDALVMARRAVVEGLRECTVILAGARPSPDADCGRNLAMCESLGIECLDWARDKESAKERLARARWIVDGIAGTGLSGQLRQPLAECVDAINAAPGRRVAVDVPSGLSDGHRPGWPMVVARVTLTMGLPKRCLYLPHARLACGRIVVIPVGFPRQLVEDVAIEGSLLDRRAFRRLAPPIPADTHKNRRGHLAVFAGALGTTGAAWLCASAAARARVGLVTLYADRDAYPVLAPMLSSVMCRPWDPPARAGGAAWDPTPYSATLVGPGWGISEARERWLARLLLLPIPGVIDADGITLLGSIASRQSVDLGSRWVLTPHPGEFCRLTGVPRDEVLLDPVAHATAASARFAAVVVLKGSCTIVASPEGRYWILDGCNPALATGGSGDVLAGIVAAGIAGGMPPLDAALFGVSLHAKVGDVAARQRGWFLAEDLVPLISTILR